jgi:acyl-CoA thioester hydrolase
MVLQNMFLLSAVPYVYMTGKSIVFCEFFRDLFKQALPIILRMCKVRGKSIQKPVNPTKARTNNVMATETSLHVKYTDVDRMGIVHHSIYPLWFEKGRRDYLRKAGASNSQIGGRGFYLPLTEMECRFKSPARHGDEVTVITRISHMSYVKLKFEYEVLEKEKGRLLVAGKTVHVWTNRRIEPINIEKEDPEIYQRLRNFYESCSTG